MSFDFEAAVGAPFRMQPGLRRMRPGSLHLTPSAAAQVRAHEPTTLRSARLLRAKLAVLAAHPWQALLARTGFDAARAWMRWPVPHGDQGKWQSHISLRAMGSCNTGP